MRGNRWTREENLAVLYMRHIGLSYSDPAIEELAGAMNRTVASVWMRRGNFDSLDTSVRGLGLSSVSELTGSIWAEYQQDPAGVLAEAREAFFSLLGDYAPVESIETPVESEPSSQHGLSATVRYAGPEDPLGTVPISSQDNMATPLHDAARMGYTDIVRALVSAGADLHSLDENGHTPLHVATRMGHADTVELLIIAGSDVNPRKGRGHTPLHSAVAGADMDRVRELISLGSDVNARDGNGRTPLHWIALHEGSEQLVQMLISAGADVNAREEKDITPLHEAARANNTEVVRMLISAGADIHAWDEMGIIPFTLRSTEAIPRWFAH